MSKLIFDIETIGNDFDKMDKETQESLTRWIKRTAENDLEYQAELRDLKDGLGFSPLTGEIVAIGLLDYDKNRGVVYFQAPGKKIKEFAKNNIVFKQKTEKQMLKDFWTGAKEYEQFVSFNGRGFDAPFLIIRSAVHQIKPTINLMPPRYAEKTNHIDLLDRLSFFGAVRRKGNLHLWCRAFGIKSPKDQGISGDDVALLFKQKKFLEIAKYNVRDIKATKELYEKVLDVLQ